MQLLHFGAPLVAEKRFWSTSIYLFYYPTNTAYNSRPIFQTRVSKLVQKISHYNKAHVQEHCKCLACSHRSIRYTEEPFKSALSILCVKQFSQGWDKRLECFCTTNNWSEMHIQVSGFPLGVSYHKVPTKSHQSLSKFTATEVPLDTGFTIWRYEIWAPPIQNKNTKNWFGPMHQNHQMRFWGIVVFIISAQWME